ncbi:tetratricopeptide repeat protein [bacterium]|nr:tetratricopeptide repeat protein [bacterium]
MMDEARWDMFFQLGMQAYQSGDFEQAREAFMVTVEEAAKIDPPDLHLARALNNLACALSQQGRLADSVALQEQALALSRDLLGEDHEVVAGGLLNLASDYGKMKRFAEAEALFLAALQRKTSQAVRIQALENLSQFYMAQEKLPETAQILQQLTPLLSDQPQGLARVLHSLAHVYDALGQTVQADAARSQTLQLIEQMWGNHTMAYGEVVANMGESLMAQGRLLEAAELYGKAARCLEQCLPKDDARLLGCRLGQLIGLRDGGRLEEAALLGAASSDGSRRWLNEYGLVLFLQQKYDQAAQLFERSLELPEELPMAGRISVLFNLASAHMGAASRGKAQSILENISGLAEEHLGGEHGMTVRIWIQLRELYRLLERPDLERAIDEKLSRYTSTQSL